METRTPIPVFSPEELIDALVKLAEPLRKDDFKQLPSGVYVHVQPWKVRTPIIYESNYVNQIKCANDRNEIINLERSQQEAFHEQLSNKHGVELRHGAFKEIVEAAYNSDEFKRNALTGKWVYALEIITPDGVGRSWRRLTPPYAVVHDGRLMTPSKHQEPYLNLIGKLQTEIPTKAGYFSDFDGFIPVDKELKPKLEYSKDHWNGVVSDNFGYSAVRCLWYSDGERLVADAGSPLDRYDLGVLGTFAERLT